MSDIAHARARASARSSARLGLVLRAIVLMPSEGFEAARRAAERRERAVQKPAEGYTPYLLGAGGGSSLLLLWLKIGGLVGLRDAPAPDFRPMYVPLTIVLGAVLGLAGQFVWGRIGPALLGSSGAEARRAMRIAWGFASLPQAVALALLLPLDLVIVGPAVLTTSGLPDPVATAWAAASIAIATACCAWSVWLFYRGCRVMVETRLLRALSAVAVAGVVVLVLHLPLVAGARFA